MSEYDINEDPFNEPVEKPEEEPKVTTGEILQAIEMTVQNTPGAKIYHRHECEDYPTCPYWINAMIIPRNPHLNQTICPTCGKTLKVVD